MKNLTDNICFDEDNPFYLGSNELSIIRDNGFKVQDLLNHIVKLGDFLLHGSIEDITNPLLPGRNGVYATTDPSVAILKALVSNRNSTLIYSSPVTKLEIKNFHEDSIRDKGYVYILKERDSFKPGHYSFEKISRVKINYIGKIEIIRSDFIYPIYNLDIGKRIE